MKGIGNLSILSNLTKLKIDLTNFNNLSSLDGLDELKSLKSLTKLNLFLGCELDFLDDNINTRDNYFNYNIKINNHYESKLLKE